MSFTIHPEPKLPWHFKVICAITHDDRTFIAWHRKPASVAGFRSDTMEFGTHELNLDGSCCTGHYFLQETEALNDIIARAKVTKKEPAPDKYEIEFSDHIKHPIANDSDAEVERIAIELGKWKREKYHDDFPCFTMYRNGEETGGG